MTSFAFLQNGLIQYYILYGVIFIITVMGFTFRKAIISFFNLIPGAGVIWNL
jgi:hypothetical protein